MSKENQPWKSVEMDPPKKSGKYIVGTCYGKVYVCQFTLLPSGQHYWGNGTGGKRIIMWMEIPKFPTPKELYKIGGEKDEG